MAPTKTFPRLYARECATLLWCHPPAILFDSEEPTCERCGWPVTWLNEPPERTAAGYAYPIVCACGEDVLVSPFRLCRGGDRSYWLAVLGYHEEPTSEEDSMRSKAATTAPEVAVDQVDDDGPKVAHQESADSAGVTGAVEDSGPGPLFLPPTRDFSVDVLSTPEYNAHVMDEAEEAALAASLETFGLVEDLVVNVHPDRFGVVVGGNKRLAQARALGQRTVPAKCVELDLAAERELNARLNANHGRFDFRLMAELGYDPAELLAWGFSETDRIAFEDASAEMSAEADRQQAAEDKVPPDQFPTVDPDKATEHTCPKCGYEWN
jgi:hypothetical protein